VLLEIPQALPQVHDRIILLRKLELQDQLLLVNEL
jgi:hypothetical protein